MKKSGINLVKGILIILPFALMSLATEEDSIGSGCSGPKDGTCTRCDLGNGSYLSICNVAGGSECTYQAVNCGDLLPQ